MRSVRLILLLGGLSLGVAGSAAAAPGDDARPVVVSVRLDGVVDPFEADYISGAIESAQDSHAAAVLLTIDTPGGLDSSMRRITEAILNSDVPVICYTSPQGARAASAGTFIMMSCPVAAMAPSTNIGAAHPVGVSGIIEQTKATNDAAKTLRSYAETWGRNASWAERAVRDAVSASAEEALRLHVIDMIEPDVPSLLTAVNGLTVTTTDGSRSYTLNTAGARIDDVGMGIGASILHALLGPELAFIFFWLGVALIVIEFLHPGIGVAGVLGVVSLAASFVSFGMLPVQLIGIVLLLASVVFFLLELKAPGLGASSAAGVVTLVLGALFLFDPSVPNARVSPWVIVPVALLVSAFFVFVVQAAMRVRRLPKSTGREPLIGARGVVTSALAPVGVVQVAGERWTAESSGATIPAGTPVEVTGMDGLRLRVAPALERVEEGSVS